MDNLIARVAAASHTTPEVAREATAAVLDFLQREAPADAMERIFEKAPALKAIAASGAQSGGEGMGAGLKGLMGVGSGSMGGGGVMALGGHLMGLGLDMTQMQALGTAIFKYVREAAGDEVVGEITAAIPGLSQFI